MEEKKKNVAVVMGGTAAMAEALNAAGISTAPTLEQKRERINEVLDEAQKIFEEMGCKYFLAALDRDPRDTDGGKVFVNLDVTGSDMPVILKHSFPSNKDMAALGIWVGNEIMRRNKDANITFRNKKRKNGKKDSAKDSE